MRLFFLFTLVCAALCATHGIPTIPIPTDRLGHIATVMIRRREDPSGETFFPTLDLNLQPAPELSTFVLLGLGLIATHLVTLWHMKKRRRSLLSRNP